MNGTLIATILSPLLALALAVALFEFRAYSGQKQAKPTQKRRDADLVTREEMEEAIEKATKALEWEWTEMYEKFEKLHLRLAKRDKRAQDKQRGEQVDQEELEIGARGAEPSILQFRRQGSL